MTENRPHAEDSSPPFYDELNAVRPSLEQAAEDPAWGELPQQMLMLIDDLEEAKRLAAGNQTTCEHIDAMHALSDFHWAQKHLDRVADSLASACRLAVHKARPEDRETPDR